MHLQYKTHILSDPKLLFYFLPRKIESDRIFCASSYFLDKTEIKLESFQYTTSDVYHNLFLCYENRFWLYGRNVGFENQEFSLSFQSMDRFNKTIIYSIRKRKLFGYSSFFSKLKLCEQLLKKSKGRSLVRGRLLRLTKGGFVSSCMDSSALVVRSSSFYKFRKHSSYKSWFTLNFFYYGILSYFTIINFEKRGNLSSFHKGKQKFLPVKTRFYLSRNKTIKCNFVLGKPKIM